MVSYGTTSEEYLMKCSKCMYRTAAYGSSKCCECKDDELASDIVDVAVGLAVGSLLGSLFDSGSSGGGSDWSGGGGSSGGGGADSSW
jgi:uncharacterized membrane protein YgcG